MTLPHALVPTTTPHRPVDLSVTVALHNLAAELPLCVFTEEIARRRLIHLVLRDLPAAHTREILPDGADLLLDIDNDSGHDHVATLGECVLWLDSWTGGGHLSVAGPDLATASGLACSLLERMRPSPAPGRVRVEFADAQVGSRHVELDARPWPEVEHLYPLPVGRAMRRLAGYSPAMDDPRLLLWHGRPGTGKTTAVRSLLDAWREWTVPVVVSDPESLLADGRYLRRILLDADEESWRLVVLEDAEALIRARDGGPLVGRLLNLADGLLGQGLRCLFLLTTNQTMDQVHPALLRPGRCLSLVEFGPLPPERAGELAGRPVSRPMTLAEVMSRDVVEASAPEPGGGYL